MDMRDVLFNEIYDLAMLDENIILLTADMGAFSLTKFEKDLPKQYINVGIAEQFMIDFAAGLSLSGKKVFVYALIPFITQRCYEQLVVNLCNMNLSVVIIGIGPGFTYGIDGPTHHALQDIAIMRAIPNMFIFSPSNPKATKKVVKEVNDRIGPSYVRLEKGSFPELSETPILEEYDLTIVATGAMVHLALEIKNILHKKSINAEVVDLCQIWPLPLSVLLASSAWNKVVTIEEHSIIGGIGSIIESIAKEKLIKKFGVIGSLTRHGDRDWLHQTYRLDANSIVEDILTHFRKIKND